MNTIIKQSIKLTWLLLVLAMASTKGFAQAQDSTGTTHIQIRVDGLSCPFCAYGLEKKLKKVEGAADLLIELEEGRVNLNVPTDQKPTKEEIQKIVTDAGFTAREIKFSETPFKEDEGSN
jgi:copper chaperone CopZ